MTTNVKLMVVFSKLNYVFMTKLGKNLEDLNMPSSIYLILAHLNIVKREKTQKLGEVAVITSGTITHVVNKLLKHGYVLKKQDKTDKRISWVEITDLGRSDFNKANKEHMKFLDSLLEDFDEEEKIEFIEKIKYFGKKMGSKELS